MINYPPSLTLSLLLVNNGNPCNHVHFQKSTPTLMVLFVVSSLENALTPLVFFQSEFIGVLSRRLWFNNMVDTLINKKMYAIVLIPCRGNYHGGHHKTIS
jgi:hypothetical protein